MSAVLTVFCLLVAGFSFWKEKYVLNPTTVMFAFWGIITPLSTIDFYGMEPPSEKAYRIIFIGLAGYLIGVLVGQFKRRKIIKLEQGYVSLHLDTSSINYVFLYVLCAISVLYFLYAGFQAFTLLRHGYTLSYIRELSTSEDANVLRSSTIMIAVKNFIATSSLYLMIAILPIELLQGKRNKLLLSLTIGMFVLWVMTTAGRSVILWVAIYFVFVFALRQRKLLCRASKTLKRKILFVFLLGGIALLLFLLYTTFSRKGEDVDLLRQAYIYFVVPIKHMDHYVEYIDTEFPNLFGLGLSSFYGIAYPLLFGLKFLGVYDAYPEFVIHIRDLSFNLLENVTYLGGDIYMNAFVTVFYQPYLDGRYAGVFIILLLFGFVCGRSYYRAAYEEDTKSLLVYLLFLQKIVFSMVRFYFTQPGQSICFVLALFSMRRKKNRTGSGEAD